MQGWQGLWGLMITSLVLVIITLSPCPFSENNCVNGHVDDMTLVYDQLSKNKNLVLLAFTSSLINALYIAFGSMSIKYSSAASTIVVS